MTNGKYLLSRYILNTVRYQVERGSLSSDFGQFTYPGCLCRHSLLHSFVRNANLMSAFSPAITMPRALQSPTLGRLLVPGRTGE